MRTTPCLLNFFLALNLMAAPPRWQPVKADFGSYVLPPLLKVVSYDFAVDFDASVDDHLFQNIKITHAPMNSASDWALNFLKLVKLVDTPSATPRRYRLKMKYSHKPKLFVRLSE